MFAFKSVVPWILSFLLALTLVGGYMLLFAAPADFVPGTTVKVERGMSAPQISAMLGDARVIAHPVLFRALLRISGKSSNVQTGLYRFDEPQNLFSVTYRLVAGAYGIPHARITFIEGVTVREAAALVAGILPGISADEFLATAKGQEGYLFPDTYFFQPDVDAASVATSMRSNFDIKIESLASDIARSGRSLSDVVTMASIIEKEARTRTDKYTVSGILWNRIALGMPLQVDAVFGYIFNRDTYSPSPADLRVDSPYNTYIHVGLPPGPINNPGLESLMAAVNPTKTDYLYYLTGNDGLMRYATSYAGHQSNLRKYLK